jgi:hypothetical protein
MQEIERISLIPVNGDGDFVSEYRIKYDCFTLGTLRVIRRSNPKWRMEIDTDTLNVDDKRKAVIWQCLANTITEQLFQCIEDSVLVGVGSPDG